MTATAEPKQQLSLTERVAQHRALPVVAIALTVVGWGVGNVLLKRTETDGVTLSWMRLWLGFAFTLPLMALAGQRPSWPSARASAIGGVLFGANVVMFFAAVKLTSVANATLVGALQPALVLCVAGPLFGERVGPRDVAASAVAIAGTAIVILGSAGAPEVSPAGDALAMGALLLFTAYFLLSKRVRETLGAVEYIAYMQLIAAIVVTPLALYRLEDPGGIPAGDWATLGFISLTGAGGHLLMNWAHPYVDATIVSVMLVGVPVVAAGCAWAILGETLGPAQIIGGAITIGAILALVAASDRSRQRDEVEIEALAREL